jgi:hypothetical protein
MGDLRLYLQEGNNPEYILVDDYNYITEWGDYSGGIEFTSNINSTSNYYEIIATVNPNVDGDVTLEFQTKLMI